ncbi:hypothetical protein GF402_05345 [Candidatus Fermentibacteria bacterium]|nr:hypothetical protein [Candidatus Fermentibacteria bacterium]
MQPVGPLHAVLEAMGPPAALDAVDHPRTVPPVFASKALLVKALSLMLHGPWEEGSDREGPRLMIRVSRYDVGMELGLPERPCRESLAKAEDVVRSMGGGFHSDQTESGAQVRLTLARAGCMGRNYSEPEVSWRRKPCRDLTACSDPVCSIDLPGRPCWLATDPSERISECPDCPVMRADVSLLQSMPSLVLLVSGSQPVLYNFSRVLHRIPGCVVVPLDRGTRALEIARSLRPQLVVIDVRIGDVDPAVLCQSLSNSLKPDGINVLEMSYPEERRVGETTLVTEVVRGLNESSSWRSRRSDIPPVALFEAESGQDRDMLCRILLSMGILPVGAEGWMDLVRRAERLRPDLVCVTEGDSSPDMASALAMMGGDRNLRDVPLLLIGGDREWSSGIFSVRLEKGCHPCEIENAVRKLMTHSGLLRPPVLFMESPWLLRLLSDALLDRYGYRPLIAHGQPTPQQLASTDTIVYQSSRPPSEEQLRSWEHGRVVRIGSRDSDEAGGVNVVTIPPDEFTLARFWQVLEED